MLSSLTRCHHSISNSFIDHWLRRRNIFVKIGVFCNRCIRSKFLYKSLKFQIIVFSTSISSLFPLMPHFSKQFLIVKLVTPLHASCSHRIATTTSTPLTICVANSSYWILASTYLTSLFRYLTFWTMPASSGCSLQVVFFDKKMILTCED